MPTSSKTTTMLFKIFGIERAWIQLGCYGPRPRQIFVTKSRVLAEKVEEYFQKFVRSLAQESEAVPPLVNDILRRSTLRGERGMVNVEEDIAWRDDLPKKYSELVDVHFPLFITFDNVSQSGFILTVSHMPRNTLYSLLRWSRQTCRTLLARRLMLGRKIVYLLILTIHC